MDVSATEIPSPAARPTPAPPNPALTEVVIRPRRGWIGIDWQELYRYRELLVFLVWRDLKVRYKQTVLGVAWAVLQPLFFMILFTAIFGNVANMKSRLPLELQDAYGVIVLAALIPWQLFATGLNNGGLSLVNQQNLLTKIYFPRLFVPTSPVGGGLVDMAIAFGLLVILMAFYGVLPFWGIVFLPALILLTVIAALGAAYTLSALSVTYRDFRFLIPFMVQALMWSSFVAFPHELMEGQSAWKSHVFALNPMYGIISGYRAAIFGLEPRWTILAVSTAVAVFSLIFGIFYFRKTERRFADIA
jgi:lipopolysaccharide transport system permease protein